MWTRKMHWCFATDLPFHAGIRSPGNALVAQPGPMFGTCTANCADACGYRQSALSASVASRANLLALKTAVKPGPFANQLADVLAAMGPQ